MNRSALIIANWQYEDAMLRGLVSPSHDAEALAEVLGSPAIGGFDVKVLSNEPHYRVCEETEAFFGDRDRDDLLLFYFSGHGITDDDGQLYYAAPNTSSKRLRSTAVAASWVNDIMNGCRSRRQVLLLDCCHSGAFARTKAGGSVNVGRYFTGPPPEEGRGKFILTASDAFQYSFEGEAVEGKVTNSVFTEALVSGLRSGEADLDGDGRVTLDELYTYVYRRVRERGVQQTPRKWSSNVEGALVIACNPHPAEATLPDDLQAAIDSFIPAARENAVPRLDRLLRGNHRGLALTARKVLETLAADDSRRVSAAAQACLAACEAETVRLEKDRPAELQTDRESAAPAPAKVKEMSAAAQTADPAKAQLPDSSAIAELETILDHQRKKDREYAKNVRRQIEERRAAKEQSNPSAETVPANEAAPPSSAEVARPSSQPPPHLELTVKTPPPEAGKLPFDRRWAYFGLAILVVSGLLGLWVSRRPSSAPVFSTLTEQTQSQAAPVSHTSDKPDHPPRRLHTYALARTLAGSSGEIFAVALGPKSHLLAAGGYGSALNIYNLATGEIVRTLKQEDVMCLAFGDDGKTLASGGLHSGLQLWNVERGERTRSLGASYQSAGLVGADSVYAIAFSPDNQRLAWGDTMQPGPGQTSFRFKVTLWNKTSEQNDAVLPGREAMGMAFSPDGSRLAAIGNSALVVWNISTWKEALVIPVKGVSLAISPNGALIASGGDDKTVTLSDAANGQKIRTLAGFPGKVRALAFSPDGRLLAVAGWGEVRLYKTEDWSIWQTLPHQAPAGSRGSGVNAVAFSPDGHWLATGGQDNIHLRVWEAQSN